MHETGRFLDDIRLDITPTYFTHPKRTGTGNEGQLSRQHESILIPSSLIPVENKAIQKVDENLDKII